MESYHHQAIEKKWQQHWVDTRLYRTREIAGRPKFYILDMFPYPSGAGLHVGHPKGYIATDVFARLKMLSGFNVLHPMGWDAFGLPAENYALKNKIHPRVSTEQNVAVFKNQLKKIGFTHDWEREINTTDPEFYRWTQWAFAEMFKRGLAYESNAPIIWCPSCKTGLANEDLEDGKCERCGSEVERQPMRQWVLRITAYAERLLNDLEKLPHWDPSIKEMQRGWIGKSEGAEVEFSINSEKVMVFTTRPDTLFGATYFVLAPEHPLVGRITTPEQAVAVEDYRQAATKKSDLERTELNKEKTGVPTGAFAINPVNGEPIPVWIADYVMLGYGTGAIMAVPAHDERDHEFAVKHGLAVKEVVAGGTDQERPFCGEGTAVNSGFLDGLATPEAKAKMIAWLEEKGLGKRAVNYKIKDWVFSRQRYWGEPFPLVYCEKCQAKVVKFLRDDTSVLEKMKQAGISNFQFLISKNDGTASEYTLGELLNPGWVIDPNLPVKLPAVESYEPTGTGESPLAAISDWVNTVCPKCGGPARRETNTMPQWAGSSWYYLRFIDPANDRALIDKTKDRYWSPVDFYVGGAEHATRHLIYSRFWHKFLYDIGAVNYEEPFTRLQHVGLILAEDGRKMSKRWNNVINPDEIVERFGADALRVYEMFMGPFSQTVAWSTNGLIGARKFLDRVWRLKEKVGDGGLTDASLRLLHKTIRKVGADIESFKLNTAVSQMMILTNALAEAPVIGKEDYERLLLILSPFAPHLTEELWADLGHKESIFLSAWPVFDPALVIDEEFELVIQVNGKVRDRVMAGADIDEEGAKRIALESEAVKKWLAGKEPKKVIYVAGKLVSIVI